MMNVRERLIEYANTRKCFGRVRRAEPWVSRMDISRLVAEGGTERVGYRLYLVRRRIDRRTPGDTHRQPAIKRA